ncbi:hypothetical protein BOX15_Mlig010193g3 [Macrostomum lignano]|uniref:ANK_REP_REGION domain-containing protein n=1 Tax=Macrostomum lignano TaxID=282301 RepID=A0A267G2S9_9PLAT|nr:hypothetical protein BOX15_Mlig010193g3 [Macrostomum lignano]
MEPDSSKGVEVPNDGDPMVSFEPQPTPPPPPSTQPPPPTQPPLPTPPNDDDCKRELLLQLTQQKKFDDAKKIIQSLKNTAAPLRRDQLLRTAVHYSAMDPSGFELLKDLTELVGAGCLATPDRNGVTPFHFAAQYLPDNAWNTFINPLVTESHLKKRDNAGNTCAHYAVREQRANDGVILSIVHKSGPRCLDVSNEIKETPLQLAVKNCTSKTVKKLLKELNPRWLQEADEEGNTVAHYAAMNPRGAVLKVVKKVGDPVLFWSNNHKETVLQIALQFCSISKSHLLLKKAVAKAAKLPGSKESKKLRQQDSTGKTCLHSTAMLSDRQEILLQAVELGKPLGPECLAWKNQAGSSVLHVALEHGRQSEPASTEVLVKLISKSTKDVLAKVDANGNTCLHIAAKRRDNHRLLREAIQKCGKDCMFWPNKRNQLVMFFAIGVVSSKELEEALKNDIPSDDFGNTLLHYLLQGYSSESVCVGLTDSAIEKQSTTDILEKIDILIAFGVDPLEENIAAQNFLHWAKLPQNLLKKLLTDFSESHGLKALYEKLDCGSNGLHLVHTYSRKYNLEVLLEPLSKLSDLKENRLLSLAVSKGDNKGATCFHFACEGGQTSSFRFLLKKGPNISVSIKTLTDSELSCIDFAIDRGHLEPVMKVYTEFEAKALQKKGIGSKAASNAARITLLRLVDPIKKAVSLPDRVAAQKALASIIDQLSDDSTACRKGRRGLQILERAITLNSTKLFRSALKMNFVNATTERLLPEFLRCQQHRNLELSVINCLCMGDKIGRHGWVDAFSELSVIDITCSHSEHYDEILLDLVLTRQFELIPASINLLIRLGPEIDKLRSQARGKHATLQELYRKVQEIAVNSLEELFASATQKRQRELLFEFLQGRIESAEGVSGPKFPFRTLNKKIRHGAVTDMIEEADCNEIFATDCIYSLVQQEWKTGRRPCRCSTCSVSNSKQSSEDCCCRCTREFYSPRAKFGTYCTFFAFLIIYFTWYTVDFKNSFAHISTDIPLIFYWLSFVSQEVVDFRRRRKRRSYLVCGRLCRWPTYFEDLLNFLEWLVIVFLLVGLILKWILLANSLPLTAAYPCQMVFSVAFGLLMFRAVHFLSLSAVIGPVITMLWSLVFNDLLPFLAIIAVIIIAFGVFFFNLLFSVTGVNTQSTYYNSPWYSWDATVAAITLPFNILFTNFEKLEFGKTLTNITIGKSAHTQGIGVFENLMLFLFMGW